MTRRLLSFVLFSGLAGLIQSAAGQAVPAAPVPSPDAAEIRVLCWNIRYASQGDLGPRAWTARRDAMAAAILQQNPDILCVQEALRPQLDDLAKRLPGYAWKGVGRDDGKDAGEFCAIFCRDTWMVLDSGTFWLSDTPEVVASSTWGNVVTRICTRATLQRPDGEKLEVWNAHWDHVSEPARQKSAQLIARRLQERKEPLPFVLCGDFNCGEDSVGVKTLKAAALSLTDTFRTAHPDEPAEKCGTFHGWSEHISGAKIDYILVPPGDRVRTITAGILRPRPESGYASDHDAVFAVIRLKG